MSSNGGSADAAAGASGDTTDEQPTYAELQAQLLAALHKITQLEDCNAIRAQEQSEQHAHTRDLEQKVCDLEAKQRRQKRQKPG